MSYKKTVFGPPIFRFLVELATWIWLIWIKWWYVFFSMLPLALLNYPGDKKPADQGVIGLAVNGYVRIGVEFGSGIIGIVAANYLFGIPGLIGQVILMLISWILDFNRWMWMIERRDEAPDYVTATHKAKE